MKIVHNLEYYTNESLVGDMRPNNILASDNIHSTQGNPQIMFGENVKRLKGAK